MNNTKQSKLFLFNKEKMIIINKIHKQKTTPISMKVRNT